MHNPNIPKCTTNKFARHKHLNQSSKRSTVLGHRKQPQLAIGQLAGHKNATMLTTRHVFQPEASAGERGVTDKVDPDLVGSGGYEPRNGVATELAQ